LLLHVTFVTLENSSIVYNHRCNNITEEFEKVTDELEKEGLGVLTEINITETLKKKLLPHLANVIKLNPKHLY
jgi:uncharacterized protein (DUF302 family)|tara:strand:- start:1064 stop:1282 length:219 start_codon:yes stop_codon:yes gene_type:complete